MTCSYAVSCFEKLVQTGSDLGVCICPARVSLQTLKESLRRKGLVDEWAPVAAPGAHDGVCPMCMDSLSSSPAVRAFLGHFNSFLLTCRHRLDASLVRAITLFARGALKTGWFTSSTTAVQFAATFVLTVARTLDLMPAKAQP
jgi:hypothetical protein